MQLKDYLNQDIVVSLLSYYGASSIDVQGEYIRCTCPIHKGDNASAFVWDLKEHLWYCHTGCHTGGDLIKLHSMINDLSERHDFLLIIEQICCLIGVDKNTLNLDAEKNKQRKDREAWFKFVNKKTMMKTNQPYNVSVLGTLQNLNTYRIYDKQTLIDNHVFYAKDMNRIAFLLYDENNVCVGATCRRVNESDKIKWLHRPKGIDTGMLLYNLNNVVLKGYTTVYIVEGCCDVISLKRIGVDNVVCTFGSHLTDEQIELLEKYFIELIFLYDNDVAGLTATLSAIDDTKYKFDVYVKCINKTSFNDAGQIEDVETFESIPTVHYIKYLEEVKENGECNNGRKY